MQEAQVAESFEGALKQFTEETGKSLQEATADVAAYAARQSALLSASVGEPGFQRNLERARANVLGMLAIRSIDEADELDQRLIGMVTMGLTIAARALVVV